MSNNTVYVALLTKTKLKILLFNVDKKNINVLSEFDNDKYVFSEFMFLVI